jgi:hypothetical protein
LIFNILPALVFHVSSVVSLTCTTYHYGAFFEAKFCNPVKIK